MIILGFCCACAELAVAPENVPKPISAIETPARTKNRPTKTRVLKNADCEVDLFFMWILWMCERSLCSRLPCEKRIRWRLFGKRSIRLNASASLPAAGGQCQYYFANRRCCFPSAKVTLLLLLLGLSYRFQFQKGFSSARTTKRFPSSRCASTIQIVRPLESIADTQPQLQPALLRLSAMTSKPFTAKQQ